MSQNFDTGVARDTLTEAGIPLEQAKAIVRSIQQGLTGTAATKEDFTEFKAATKEDFAELKEDFISVKEDVKEEMLKLDKKLDASLKEMAVSWKEVVIKGVVMLTVGGLIVAAIKYL